MRPAFNWFCVLCSAADVLAHATRIRAAQITCRAPVVTVITRKRRRNEVGLEAWHTQHSEKVPRKDGDFLGSALSFTDDGLVLNAGTHHEADISTGKNATHAPLKSNPHPISSSAIRRSPTTASLEDKPETSHLGDKVTLVSDASVVTTIKSGDSDEPVELFLPPSLRHLQSSKVPSSKIGRFFHYGGLAASLTYGAASSLLQGENSSSLLMTEANIKRLVEKLSKMRGAALKLGQFLSIQDTHILPPEMDSIFRRVQDSAHYMPDWQMEQVMTTSLGPSWSSHFTSFDRIPFAAASIGQVHAATLAPSGGEERRVAVKIQFPNIVNSIESDLGYIKLLLSAGRLLPKGLFLDRTVQVMKAELADECDYAREASFIRLFGTTPYLGADPRFKIPWVWEGSTDKVLVMEYVDGRSVGEVDVGGVNQQDRDTIAGRVIELCLKELFVFRVMQTDPNWTNFLWNGRTRQIELVDFGATREYSKKFMDNWLRLLKAAAEDDREGCVEWSLKLGYLTGEENETMLDAHVSSMTLLATPFKSGTPQPFAFGQDSEWSDITKKIREQIPVMLRERLTPPPRETYSLNRKLSGAFLLASRLGANVDTKTLWDDVLEGYRFGEVE